GSPPPFPSDRATPGMPSSGLEGSLFYHFVQTDNFYADRRPTLFHGHALYIPDLAIGRLVESTDDIYSYLQAYSTYASCCGGYTINADRPDFGHVGAAYVTGYDFVKDEAAAIKSLYQQYGFKLGATLGTTFTVSGLISDTWTVNDLTNGWFSGQLPQ